MLNIFVFYCSHGIRNSLLLAPMPTASTAQILGNNESIEPYTSNIYTRRTLSGEFQVKVPCLTVVNIQTVDITPIKQFTQGYLNALHF